MKKLLGSALSLLLAVCGGCLEFDAQEIVMRYDSEADRIDCLVVYRGIFVEVGSNTNETAMRSAFADLEKVLDHGQCFFWCNWPAALDPTKTKGDIAPFLSHVEVENGKLFTDPEGRLHGYQFVRIVRAKEFLKKLNMALGLAYQAAFVVGAGDVEFDPDTKENAIEFSRTGEPPLTVEAGRIQLRVPCSAPDFRKLLRELEDHMLRNEPSNALHRVVLEKRKAEGDSDLEVKRDERVATLDVEQLRDLMRKMPGMRFFWDNDFTVERTEELQTIGIGVEGSSELRVLKASDGRYSDNFLKALRERGHEIEDGIPDQEIQRRFDEFLQRDAVLPDGLKAARAEK